MSTRRVATTRRSGVSVDGEPPTRAGGSAPARRAAQGGGNSHTVSVHVSGRRKAGQQLTEGAFNKAWRKARIQAGCPDRIPHDFRRTAVRNLVRAAVPERVAMQLTGHKTRAVFERDNIVSAGDLRDAARQLDIFASGAAS